MIQPLKGHTFLQDIPSTRAKTVHPSVKINFFPKRGALKRSGWSLGMGLAEALASLQVSFDLGYDRVSLLIARLASR